MLTIMRSWSTKGVIIVIGLMCTGLLPALAAGSPQKAADKPPTVAAGAPLSIEEVRTMPKIDAHAHVNALVPRQRERLASFLTEHNFTWLATDEMADVPRASRSFRSRGLALPAAVVRKLYYENARRCYRLARNP